MKKILIVDDFEGNRELLEDILSDCYETDTAMDGQEAIDKIKENNDYSMILLDLMMPKVDGFGVLEYMKKNGLLENCPVIIISGDANAETEGKCFDYGVSDFIAKPFKEKIILKRVENILSLKESIRMAELANESKTSFLFNLSHDIRTPMNAIIGYSMLLGEVLDGKETALDYLSKIKSSSDFLLSLINSVLEISRIETGHVSLIEELVNTESVAKSLNDVFSDRMKQKKIKFVYDYKVSTKYVYMDKVKVNEIFLNLLSNAYKYTKEGGSVFFFVEEKPSDKKGYAVIQTTIADTGIGMSEEYLPTLFEEFSREQSAAVNKIEGTGLGMSIVKKLVDVMGGTIDVKSRPGKGTTFVVSLQHKIGEETVEAPKKKVEYDLSVLSGKRVLLAEDNELNTKLAKIILERQGIIVEHAEDGVICVDMLRQSKENYYDLILMDGKMPNMSGYEATAKIRELENPYQRNIPVIAMTADAFEENIRVFKDAGMNGYVSKPFDIQVLFETMINVLTECHGL